MPRVRVNRSRSKSNGEPGFVKSFSAAIMASFFGWLIKGHLFHGPIAKADLKQEILTEVKKDCKGDLQCEGIVASSVRTCLSDASEKLDKDEINDVGWCVTQTAGKAIVLENCGDNLDCTSSVSANFDHCFDVVTDGFTFWTEASNNRFVKNVVSCINSNSDRPVLVFKGTIWDT